MKSRKISMESNDLVASIARFETTYHISEFRIDGENRVDDEVIIDIVARIEMIDGRHKHLVGTPIEVSVCCANSFASNESLQSNYTSMISSLRLKKDGCLALTYLPRDAFWALRAMLSDGEIGQLQIRYDRPRYGNANVQSFYFASASRTLNG